VETVLESRLAAERERLAQAKAVAEKEPGQDFSNILK